MKKLIIIILLIPLLLNAQKETKIHGEYIRDNKINKFTLSLKGSSYVEKTTYKYLREDTNLSEFWCKFIASNGWDIKRVKYSESNRVQDLAMIESITFESVNNRLKKKVLVRELNNGCYE